MITCPSGTTVLFPNARENGNLFLTISLRGCPIVYSLWRAQPVQKEQAMSDNLRRYRAIRDAFIQCYPGQPSGTVIRHLITLAALLSGIVSSQSTQLPHSAAHV